MEVNNLVFVVFIFCVNFLNLFKEKIENFIFLYLLEYNLCMLYVIVFFFIIL